MEKQYVKYVVTTNFTLYWKRLYKNYLYARLLKIWNEKSDKINECSFEKESL